MLFCPCSVSPPGSFGFFSSTGCIDGNGVEKSETRSVPSFDAVVAGGTFDLRIVCQKEQRLQITADANLHQYISTRVDGGVLHIETKKSVCPRLPIQVDISAENISRISLSGVNNATVSGLNNLSLYLDLDGSGSVQADGKTGNLQVTISGSTELDARKLRSDNASIYIGGVGDAYVNVSNALQGHISGVGSIYYQDRPRNIEENITGIGALIEIGE